MGSSIDVNTVKEEVAKIFGKNAKNKLKTLVKNEKVYSKVDSLKTDIEILADKSAFDELLTKEDWYFQNVRSFDPNDTVGQMSHREFGTMYSRSNMSTAKSVHGVKNNAYQYEVQLKSNGSMYLGWATRNCVFNEVRGVGETANSYGFDGYSMNKWNKSNDNPYGKRWRVGNIIGCVIDLPKKTVEYFNNGRSLGVAFSELNEPEYFPAISLYLDEHVSVNLGERPFKFPVRNANPVVGKPTAVICYFEQLQQNIVSLIDSKISLHALTKRNVQYSDKLVINNVMSDVLFHQFAYLLRFPYIVDGYFLPFLNHLCKKQPKKLQVLLELMWENIPESETVFIMGLLMFCMLCEFQCTWRNVFDVSHQTAVLKLLIRICGDTTTRKQLIVKIFFDSVKFAHFLHVIAPSDEMFDYMVPKVYWRLDERTMPEDVKTELLKYYPRDYQKNNESSYNSACNKIKHLLDELVQLQLAFVKVLLNDDDQTETKVSSRILFSRRFQSFVQENTSFWRNDTVLRISSPVLLSALFRLSCVVRELWNGELKEDNVARVQHGIFYSDHFNYFGVDRIGGTFSYLKSKYGDNAKPKDDERVSDCDETTDTEYNDDNDQSQNDDDSLETEAEVNENTDQPIDINSMRGLIEILSRIIGNATHRYANLRDIVDADSNGIFAFDNTPTDKRHVLSVLLNNIICLYFVAGHKQLSEYMSFKSKLSELSVNFAMMYYHLKTVTDDQYYYQQKFKEIENKIVMSCRYMAWLMNMIFVNANENVLEWILAVVSNTIKHCSRTEGERFRFVPLYYVDNMLTLLILLPNYQNRIEKFDSIVIEKKWLATLIGEILLEAIGDVRIVHPRLKHMIIEAVTFFLTHPKSVNIIQGIAEELRCRAIELILNSPDRSLWPKANMILMLIWHGSGYAFRHKRPPHLENYFLHITGSIDEIVFTNTGTERPPATVLQNDVRQIIASNRETASHYINKSLNYLNWAFSEFISLFQEINDINDDVNDTDTITITAEQTRNLRKCGKSFVYTVSLLRVIEMMIHFDRTLVTDQQGSLSRTFQLICQILNRTRTSTSTFQHVAMSSLPYIEVIHKFPILVPVVGVLLAILDDEIYYETTTKNADSEYRIPEITDMLISDPNFNLSSLDFVVIPAQDTDEPFAFSSYKSYFTDEELNKAVIMYQHLDWCTKRHISMASSVNEEDLCIICYSNKNSAILQPCEHQCCIFCIDHHLLYSRVCFFCKRRIESVADINDPSNVLYDFGKEPPPMP